MGKKHRKNLCEIPKVELPDNVFAISTDAALDILDISQSTLRDYKSCLDYEQPEGWDYEKGQKGVTRQQLQILAILNYLVKYLGRTAAQKHLNHVVSQYFKRKETEDNG